MTPSSPRAWVYTEELSPLPEAKTRRWQVRASDGGWILGIIKWYGPWRKYAFFPETNTIYEEDCLRQIAQFVVNETTLHRERNKQERAKRKRGEMT